MLSKNKEKISQKDSLLTHFKQNTIDRRRDINSYSIVYGIELQNCGHQKVSEHFAPFNLSLYGWAEKERTTLFP